MSRTIDRRVLPLYVVVFVGFLGYSLMIATFTPMILRNGTGMQPAGSSLTQRSLVLGCCWPCTHSGSFSDHRSSGPCRIAMDVGPF
jgi:hypothetical protein